MPAGHIELAKTRISPRARMKLTGTVIEILSVRSNEGMVIGHEDDIVGTDLE